MLDSSQVKMIEEHLALVLTKVTPGEVASSVKELLANRDVLRKQMHEEHWEEQDHDVNDVETLKAKFRERLFNPNYHGSNGTEIPPLNLCGDRTLTPEQLKAADKEGDELAKEVQERMKGLGKDDLLPGGHGFVPTRGPTRYC